MINLLLTVKESFYRAKEVTNHWNTTKQIECEHLQQFSNVDSEQIACCRNRSLCLYVRYQYDRNTPYLAVSQGLALHATVRKAVHSSISCLLIIRKIWQHNKLSQKIGLTVSLLIKYYAFASKDTVIRFAFLKYHIFSVLSIFTLKRHWQTIGPEKKKRPKRPDRARGANAICMRKHNGEFTIQNRQSMTIWPKLVFLF